MPNSLTSYIDTCTCPVCNKPNHCAMATAQNMEPPTAPCWCVNMAFSAELLAQVPEWAQRKACICQSCATKAAHD